MKLKNNTKNCTIYNRSFMEDMYTYSIIGNGTPLSIKFDDSASTSSTVTSRMSPFISDISSILSDFSEWDIWYPIFINSDDWILNKKLSPNGAIVGSNSNIRSGRLGIEDVYSFIPKLKQWNTGSSEMVIDWILNRSDLPYTLEYGIMCWARLVDNTVAGPITDFPIYSRLILSGDDPNNIYIKLDNETLFLAGSDSSLFDRNNINFPGGTETIEVSSLGSNPRFSLSTVKVVENRKNNVALSSSPSFDGFELWVPNGDCFSYFKNPAAETRESAVGIPSKDYISPSLYSSYNAIYNILTNKEVKYFGSKNLKKSRSYKKLAHYLSTSPFITQSTIEALNNNDIQELVNTYITGSSDSVATEQNRLLDTLVAISRVIQSEVGSQDSLDLDVRLTKETTNDNIITNEKTLFAKLINKYGCKLKINTTSTITYTGRMQHGDSVLLSQIYDTYCDKTLTNTNIFNNQTITLSPSNTFFNTKIQTDLGYLKGNIDFYVDGIKKQTAHLYDAIKPHITSDFSMNIVMEEVTNVRGRNMDDGQDDRTPADKIGSPENFIFRYGEPVPNIEDLSKDVRTEINYPKFSVFNFNHDSLFIVRDSPYTPAMLEGEKQIICFWEKISGPPMKFIDNNRNPKKLYDTATSREISVVPSRTGRYVIQCTCVTPFGKFTLTKLFYIIDGRQRVDFPGALNTEPNPKYLWFDYATFEENGDVVYQQTNDTTIINADLPQILAERTPIIPNYSNLRVNISDMSKVAIHRNGVFWPIKTNFKVERIYGSNDQRSIDNLEGNKYKFFFKNANPNVGDASSGISIEYNCNNTILKLERIILENLRNNTDECSQCLSICEPKLIGYPFTRLGQPPSLSYYRDDGTFTLQSYTNTPLIPDSIGEMVDYPGFDSVSTDYAPNIYTYGGYSSQVIDKLGINIPNLAQPLANTTNTSPYQAETPFPLPKITGYKLDYKNTVTSAGGTPENGYKLCYQKALDVIDEEYSGKDSFIEFTKGVFHPASGWISYSDPKYNTSIANTCSVLKFNPGARDSFSFTGPGIFGFNSADVVDTINNNAIVIQPNIYSSSIKLDIAPGVRWSPRCECPPSDSSTDAERQAYSARGTIHEFINQAHKEFIDQYYGGNNSYHHGYRILGGGLPKLSEQTGGDIGPTMDEFIFSSENNINDPQFNYSFTVTGPPNKIGSAVDSGILDSIRSGNPGTTTITPSSYAPRNPRVNTFTIKDIEVKLNFLNYINTKDLIVWLEVEPCASEKRRQTARNARIKPPPITAPQEFIDQTFPSQIQNTHGLADWLNNTSSATIPTGLNMAGVGSYLKSLTDMNSSSSPASNFKIFLLNQEYITNNGYNFSVKFSDEALQHTVRHLSDFDTSKYQSQFSDNSEENPVQTDGILPPTMSAFGYSEKDATIYSKIINTNKLHITNNYFSKLKSKPLFMSPGPEEGPCGREGLPKQKDVSFDSYTKFTLKIAIVDDPDEMVVYDTLISNQLYTNFDSIDNVQKSSEIFKSLCNWELILHVNDTKKPSPTIASDLSIYGNADALSLIEYGKEPQYPGYSFIADLTGSKFLLPFANMNAPNVYFQDFSLCQSADPDAIGTTIIKGPPTFPIEAALAISAALFGGTTGTILGTLGGFGAGYYIGFQQLLDYFSDLRFFRDLDRRLGNIYNINYKNYSFGSPEKVMLNISKDGCFWYKVEASIFRYKNTPILKNNKYKFVRLIRNNVPRLSEFSFQYVDNLENLIDSNFIKNITVKNCEDYNTYASQVTGNIEGVEIVNGDIFSITIGNSDDPCGGSGSGSGGGGSGCGDCACSAGTYICHDGSWHKLINPDPENCSATTYPEKIVRSFLYTQYNSVLGYYKSIFNDFADKISNKKLIIIDSKIPYDIFNIGDTLEFYTDSTRNTNDSIINSVIVNKAKIIINNNYSTILELETSPGTNDIVCGKGDVVVAYQNNSTKINNKKEIPFGEWSFEKRDIEQNIPEINFTTNSIGSYGDGSPSVQKNVLTYTIKKNRLDKLYDIYNNHNNSKFKYNKITLNVTTTTGDQIWNYDGKSSGFSYDINEVKKIISTQKNINKTIKGNQWTGGPSASKNTDDQVESIEKLLDEIQYKIPNSFDNIKNIIYIKNTSIKDLPNTILNGEIIIENDYIVNEPTEIEYGTGASFSTINTRLRALEAKINDEPGSNQPVMPSYEALIGKSVNNATLAGYNSSIDQLQRHYNLVTSDLKPSELYDEQYVNLLQSLMNKYLERDNIIKFFKEINAIRKTTISYKENDSDESVTDAIIVSEDESYITVKNTASGQSGSGQPPAPETVKIDKQTITARDDTWYEQSVSPGFTDQGLAKRKVKVSLINNQYHFEYTETNNNHYWINIDPKQSCSIAEDLRPRVLKKTEYKCTLLNPTNTILTVNNNICPQFASSAGSTIQDGGVENFQDSGGNFIYTIPEATIDIKKEELTSKYGESIAGWKEIFIDRSFYMYTDQDLSVFNNSEFIVSVRETYDVAIPAYEAIPGWPSATAVAKAIAQDLIKNDYSADTIPVPGIPGDGACNVDVSPPGIGLVGDGNSGRAGRPTRVYSILNLDDTDRLKVKFRKMPRQLRGIDLLGTVFRYGKNGLYRQLNPGNPIIPIDMGSSEHQINNMYVWECLQKAADGKLEKTSAPKFFQVLDEMMFRAFYGSVDEIEIKSDVISSNYAHDMIPFEYFNAPPP